jgi:hypothetical protein
MNGCIRTAGKPLPQPPRPMFNLDQKLDALIRPYASSWRKEENMERLGIRNIMRAAKLYNRWRYRERARRHDEAYATQLNKLLIKNGGPGSENPRITLEDGWAIDTSMSLPHLDRLLDEAGQVVRDRGGRIHSDIQRPYFRNLMFPEDLGKYPSWLDFITSSEILATVTRYLKTIPVLSKTRPPGVRFMESNQNLDPDPPGAFADSQLYHLDLHDNPLVYVIVLIEDVTAECGPWHFLPASVSDRAVKALGNQKRGRPYRVTDEAMHAVVDPKESIVFAYPKGTVLFIDSSRCFHYGSRLSYKPRLQMMYAYTSVCRCDFSQTTMPSFPYPIRKGSSKLRKMVLE